MANSASPGMNTLKLDLLETNPDAAAAMSKAIVDRTSFSGFDLNKRETHNVLNQGRLQAISDVQKQRLSENDDVMDLFPDIVMARQTIVGSVLAPKDMYQPNLIYQGVQQLVPASTQSKLDQVVQRHMEGHYDILNQLPEILNDAIFKTGSFVSAVIPEAAVDKIINGRTYATESHKGLIDEIVGPTGASRPLGTILGPPTSTRKGTAALEDFLNGDVQIGTPEGSVSLNKSLPFNLRPMQTKTEKVDGKQVVKPVAPSLKPSDYFTSTSTEGFLEITDNYQVTKLPKLLQEIASQRVQRAIENPSYSTYGEVAAEAYGTVDKDRLVDPKKLSDQEVKNLVYKNKGMGDTEMLVTVPNSDAQKRHSIGRPLRMRIPSEAVIPVYPPGDPSNHRGYFVLVDMDGNWVTRSSVDITSQGLQSMMANQNQNNTMSTLMLNRTSNAMKDARPDIMLDNMLEIYSSIVEDDMINRLKNGVYGTTMEIGHDKEWDRIMLARALKGKMTRIVYFPKELITYYAYDYHQNGIGKSYLDQVKMLTCLRALILFSKTMAQLKMAINTTQVEMNLDPNDPDPQKAIEMAKHDIMRMRESFFPLGTNDPMELVHWIQRAGLMFSFKNHPGLPETSFQFNNVNLQHQLPDNQLDEDLRKQTFMAFGLSPEQIDQGFSPEFATTVIQQNALFARRILLLSNQTAKLLSNDVRNICTSDPIITKELRAVLVEAKEDILKYLTDEDKEDYAKDKDMFLKNFLKRVIANIWVDLPKPDIGSTTRKAEAFINYKETVEKVIDSYISTEVFTDSVNGQFSTHVDEIKNFWKHYLLRKWVTEENFLPDIAEVYKRDENGQPANDILAIMTSHAEDVMLGAMKFIEKMKGSKEVTNKDLEKMNVAEGQAAPTSSGSDDSGGGDGNDMFDMGGDGDGAGEPEIGATLDDMSLPSEAGDANNAKLDEAENTDEPEVGGDGPGGIGGFRQF